MEKTIALLSILFVLITLNFSFAAEFPKDQKAWCDQQGGKAKYKVDAQTRVDCLLPDAAVMIDSAHSWSQLLGDALYCGVKTNRKPGVVLLMRDNSDEKYLQRLKAVAGQYDIKIWTVNIDVRENLPPWER